MHAYFEDAALLSRKFEQFSGNKIPPEYLQGALCKIFFYGSSIVGGYAIITNNKKRSIRQIPRWDDSDIYNFYQRRAAEITCYFIVEKHLAWHLLIHYFFDVMLCSRKHFVYSYDKNNPKLEKLYSAGRPVRLYSGYVNNLEGMTGKHYENVEVLTKAGFLRLYFDRIIRRMKKWSLC